MFNSVVTRLKKIHYWLLPREKDLGMQPYVWLCYLGIYFFNWFFRTPSQEEVVHTLLGISIFLVLYFSIYRRRGLVRIIHIFGIYLIGVWLSFYNVGASVFFVFAASFCSHLKTPQYGFLGIALIAIAIAVQAWWFELPSYFYLPGIFFSILIGVSNIYFVQMTIKNAQLKASQSDIKRLATTAERERIARDLHDLIGHTFSLMTKKAELAGRFIDQSPELAKAEISDIEQLSRDALMQVREAVTGYRQRNVKTEIIHARRLCDACDIELTTEVNTELLSSKIDEVFAYCIREAVTNTTRHSDATAISIVLISDSKKVRLKICDNGQSVKAQVLLGNGLKGLQERLESINGELTIEPITTNAKQGLCVIAEVNVDHE